MKAPETHSYWSVVGRQLRKNRSAMVGFRCIVGLAALAVFTPLLASSRPFYFRVGGEAARWPWLRDLFNRNVVQQPVDLFFNLLMASSPFAVGAWFLLLRGASLRRRFAWIGGVFLWIFLGIYLPEKAVERPLLKVVFAPGVALRKAQTRAPVDYHELEEEARKAGKEVTAVWPPLPYSFEYSRVKESTQPPSFAPDESVGAVAWHPLGTDQGGRDVLTALLYGTRISMTIGVISVAISVTIGIILGSLAGYFGGWVDILISRFVEIMICFPTLFFVLTIVSVFETRTIFLIMAVLGLTSWTGVSRLVRGEFLTQRGLDYVTAANALGLPRGRIIFRHVLPNALTPVLVSATFGVAAAILAESSIAFLGLGDTSAASWGTILSQGRQNGLLWLILSPGIAIFFTVTVFNLLGEGVRDALDPKLRR
jgi:peptide/nickel transport system permease protein